MKKQSSIEWLIEQLTIHTWYDNDNNAQVNIDAIDINQAKQMHNEEIIESYVEGADTGEMFNNENRVFTTDAKQYYNEKYKSE